MANKPAPRNWNDVQIAIAVTSMALTLAFWNLFAGPDRELAFKRAQEQAAKDQTERARATQAQTAPMVVAPTPTKMTGPLLLGGSAPQTVIIQSGGGGGGGGSGGGGGGGTGGS